MAENVALYKEAIKAGIALQNKSVEDLKRDLALYQANQKPILKLIPHTKMPNRQELLI